MQRNTCQVFLEQCQRDRERVVLYLLHAGQADRPVTAGDLLSASAAYARLLAQRGIQPGEVVLLILQHGLDLMAAFWGAVLHGAIPSIMPFLTEKLLPERYRRDLAALVAITRPAAIVTYSEFEDEIEGLVNASETIRAVILSADFSSGLAERHSVFTSITDDHNQPVANIFTGYDRPDEDIVFLQHSSGTTGLQKGVAISHRALLNQLDSYREAIRLTHDDVIVSWLPLYHDMGLIAGFLMPILEGIPLVLLSPFDWVKDPARLFKAVSTYKGTLSWLPNFAYNFCAQKVRESQMEGVDLATWRAVINCSEPMSAVSFERFERRFGAYGLRPGSLATSYAMAENVFGVTQGGIDSPVVVDTVDLVLLQSEGVARPVTGEQNGQRPAVKMLSCGAPIPGTQVKVLSGDGQSQPERQVGELAVRSNCMLTGYYNRPDATAQVFSDGWYRTGDLGYVAGGEVYVTGRKKDLIITGGRNIFPQDLEALANEVPGVHPGRVAAFGIFDDQLGTEVIGLVAEVDLPGERGGSTEDCQALEDAIRFAVNQGSAVSLRYVRLVGPGWLVKTSSGKTARSANRDKFLTELAAGVYVSPCPGEWE